jgi:hypothetical protein
VTFRRRNVEPEEVEGDVEVEGELVRVQSIV